MGDCHSYTLRIRNLAIANRSSVSCAHNTSRVSIVHVTDLEIWVRGHSRSLKIILFESLDTVSYLHSVITMALPCIVCEI